MNWPRDRLSVFVTDNLPAILSSLREREAVVAWLRSNQECPYEAEYLANAIEAGEHMKGEGE